MPGLRSFRRKQRLGLLVKSPYMVSKPKFLVRSVVRNRRPKGRYIKGAIAPFGGRKELKYVDTVLADKDFDTTGSVTALNLIAVGDDNVNRDGRQVTIKSVQLKCVIRPIDSAVAENSCRCLLVWDNAVNSGTIATVANILTTAVPEAFPNIDNAKRFTILKDSHIHFGPNTSDTVQLTYGNSAKNYPTWDVYQKINKVTQYSGTTAAIGSIQNGGLLLVTIGDVAPGTANYKLDGQARVRFTDD